MTLVHFDAVSVGRRKKINGSHSLGRPWSHTRERSSGRELGKLPRSTSRSLWHSGRNNILPLVVTL